jgi:hypothetical protein
MGYGLRRNKVKGGSGGKRGHSNMAHWEYTEEIKQRSRKARRRAAKVLEREARQAQE